ncbi:MULTISPECIES: hypothetical protein [unclassified Nocardiopsis]|uniref:hypothetical protein n=1 Tax=unclassified Nocardiopsis TaxID=2649073 RepID=UPI0033FCFCC6
MGSAHTGRPRDRWYFRRNRHYYHDGPDFAPRGGGLGAVLGCLGAVVALLAVLLVVALLL